MGTGATEPAKTADRQWFIVGRWQEFEGEARANLLRIVGVGGFYAVELLNYYGLSLGRFQRAPGVSLGFHQSMTALAAAWVGVALVVLYCLRQRIFPPAMKYCSTAADLLLLTATLMAAGGAASPLVVALFVVLAMSALRFSLGLVRFATVGSILVYLAAYAYSRTFGELVTKVLYHRALLMLVALGLTGLVLGQVVRRVRRVAEEYAARCAAKPEQTS